MILQGASWFIEFVIACCVGAVGMISSAIGFYKLAKHNASKSSEAVETLQAELGKREGEVRVSASLLADRTAGHVEGIAKASKAQRKAVNHCVRTVGDSAANLHQAAKALPESAAALLHASQTAERKLSQVTSELNAARAEITKMNQSLKALQRQFNKKEKALENSLKRLKALETQLNQQPLANTEVVDKLTQQLAEMRRALPKQSKLVADNRALEATVARFRRDFNRLTDANKSQVEEIKSLLTENSRLKQAVKSLTSRLETYVDEAESEVNQTRNRQGLRLFT